MAANTTPRKKCQGCRCVLELAAFSKQKRSKDGHNRLCHVCFRLQQTDQPATTPGGDSE